MMFDTKTNFLSFVDPKLWPFKSWRYQKISKFWNAHNTPPRGPRAEKFWFSKFLPRGYLHAKNDQNRWDKGVKLLWSPLEWAIALRWPKDSFYMRPSMSIRGLSINPSVSQSVHGSNFLENEQKINIFVQIWAIK